MISPHIPRTSQPAWLSISAIIPTRNRGALIEETLTALLSIDYPLFEIIIIDQSTDDATMKSVERVAGGDLRVRYQRSAAIGSSSARNHGARLSAAELVAYTDDDCIVAGGWIEAIVREFEDPTVAAVYGRLLPHGFVERTGNEVGFNPSMQRREFIDRTPPWYIGHGGNMSFRRAVLLEAGGFDPLLGAGGRFGACEDPDIAYRLLARGQKVVYSPAPLAYHKHWKNWPAQARMERAYGIGAGAQFAKYVRCGDRYGYHLLMVWIWQMGVRRIGAGLFKWRSLKTVYLGYCQMIYPWFGMARSRSQPLRRDLLIYQERDHE